MSLAAVPSHLNSYQRIVDALGEQGFHPQTRGDQTMALCPVHGDTHRSLSITYQRENERTMVHCFTESCRAGYVEVLEALGLDPKSAFDKPLERSGERHPRQRTERPARKPLPPRIATKAQKPADVPRDAWREVIRYRYANDLGVTVLEVIRLEAMVDGRRMKTFKQRYLNPATGRWVNRKSAAAGFAPVIYNQQAVKTALAADQPVWIVEGEKDADSAIAQGLVATTNAEGAGSFPPELLGMFAGRSVRIVADNDPSGAKSAADLHDQLIALEPAAEVVLYLPAVDAPKADLTDHLEQGHHLDELRQMSVEDARALVNLGAVKTALGRLQDARAEAEAYLAIDDLESGTAWVHETEKQLQWVRAEAEKLSDVSGTDISVDAAVTAAAYLEEATAARNAAHELIGIATAPAAPALPHIDPAPSVHLVPGGGKALSSGDDGDIFLGIGPEDDSKSPNIMPRFLVRRGQTVQRTEGENGPRYRVIFDGWAQVMEERTFDDGDPSEITKTRDSWVFKWFRWRRDADGNVLRWDNGNPQVDEAITTFDHDMIRNRSWVNALPWSGMLLDTSTRGISLAWTAIFQARRVAPDAAKTVYTTPGWRHSDTGPFYVHRDGAIGKGGAIPGVQAKFSATGPFSMYKLPDPGPATAADLRTAWIEGTVPLVNELPARILAPLLAVVWHSPLGKSELLTHLAGARAAAKTGTAALACQYFAPLAYYGAPRQAMMSLADQGSSLAGLFQAGGRFGHVPAMLDDAAPDGAVDKVRKKLGDFARQFHNRVPKTVGGRDGTEREYRQLLFTPISTGELLPDASNLSRTLVIPLHPRDIPNVSTRYPKLETEARRTARSLLGAALVQYVAQHWDDLHEERDLHSETLQRLMREWLDRLDFLGDGSDGIKSRYAGDAIRRHFGVLLMLRMLIERGALTEAEAKDFENWAIDGLTEAYRQQETGGSDPAKQTIGRLREALSIGITHITNRLGGSPQDELEQAGYRGALPALGWRERAGFNNETIAEPLGRGDRCGVIVGDELWLIPSRTFEVAAKMAAAGGESFNETITSIGSSMLAHKWLRTGSSHKTLSKQRIGGSPTNVWAIPLSVLFDDDDTTSSSDETTPETPEDPSDTAQPLPLPEIPAPLQEAAPAAVPAASTVQSTASKTAATAPAAAPAATSETPHQQAAAATPAACPPGFGTTGQALQLASHAAPQGVLPRVASEHVFRAAVAVLHSDGLWLPDGSHYQIPEIRHFGSLVNLAVQLDLGCRRGGWMVDVPTIYLTKPAAEQLGIPMGDLLSRSAIERTQALEEATKGHPMVARATAEGWNVGEKGCVQGFTRVHAPSSSQSREARYIGARIALLPMAVDALRGALEDNPTPAQLAARLQRVADYGMPFTVSAGATGRNLMQDTVFPRPENRQWREEFMAPSQPIFPATIGSLEDDISWSRVPTEGERSLEFVHAYDRNGSYLAGVSGTYFGRGDATHFPQGCPFQGQQKQAYYRVQLPETMPWNVPSPFGAHNDARLGKDAWITTQTYAIATSTYDMDLPILEAYVWEQSHKALDRWAQALSTASVDLNTDDPDDRGARSIVKAIYVQTIGQMNSTKDYGMKMRGYAPERRHQIIARARANLLYRIHQIGTDTGQWPLAILKDTVLYGSNLEDAAAAWPGKPEHLSKKLGSYKVEGSARMSEQLPFFTGNGYKGKFGIER